MMKRTNRIICLILAVVMAFSTMALITAIAEDPTTSESTDGTRTTVDTETSETAADTSASTPAAETAGAQAAEAPVVDEDPPPTGGPLADNHVFDFAHNWENRRLLTNNQMLELLGRNPAAPGATTPFIPETTTAGVTAALNADGSLRMSKSGTQRGANLEIPVTDDMRAAFANTGTYNRMTVSFWLSQAIRTVNLMPNTFSNSQVRVYARFENSFTQTVGTDTFQSYLNLSSMASVALQAYQQTSINREFQLRNPANEVLTSLDDVYSIIITLYDYHTPTTNATLQMSGFVYTGEPAVTQFEPPAPQAPGTVLPMVNWGPNYNRGWGRPPAPQAPRFNPEPSNNWDDFATVRRSGYMMFRNSTPVVTDAGVGRQVDFFFDFDRDEFALAVETANQPGGSGLAQITVNAFDLRCRDGNPMRAEIDVSVAEFGAATDAAPTRLHAPIWVSHGEQRTIELDVSEITSTNISHVRFAVMQWWFLDSTRGNQTTPGAYLDLSSPIREGNRTFVMNDLNQRIEVTGRPISPPGPQFSRPVMQDMHFLVSPIRTGNVREVIIAPPTTTAPREDADPYGGMPFFIFTPEAHQAYYGNLPRFVDFLRDDYMHRFARVRRGFTAPGGALGVRHTAANWPSGASADFVTPENPATEPLIPLTHEWYVNAIRESRERVDWPRDWTQEVEGMQHGYVVGVRSPFPHQITGAEGRHNVQHQAFFWSSQEMENRWRAGTSHLGLGSDHPNNQPLPPQNDDYDFRPMMREALRVSRNRGNTNLNNVIAIDVFVLRSLHGWRHLRNQTYVNALQSERPPRTPVDQNSAVQVEIMIHAREGELERSISVDRWVTPGRRTTIYINLEDITNADWIYGIRVAPQNYANLRHREDGGDNNPSGITDVHVWFSNLYLPGEGATHTTTTRYVTTIRPAVIRRILRLWRAVPGYPDPQLHHFNTVDDYRALAAFLKAFDDANEAEREYLAENHGMDIDWYIRMMMLYRAVWDRIFGAGAPLSPSTGDLAFPMVALFLASGAGYVLIRGRKKKESS